MHFSQSFAFRHCGMCVLDFYGSKLLKAFGNIQSVFLHIRQFPTFCNIFLSPLLVYIFGIGFEV
jgi:hypothetical protein